MPLNKQLISNHLTLASRELIHDIQIFDSVTSTNDVLHGQLKSNPQTITAIFAEMQTAGRGRQGRPWVSPANTNIYFSLSWYFQKSISALSGISLVVGIAIVRALKIFGISESVKIKWPNDILFENKKLGGILIESIAVDACNTSLMIGVGLNINLSKENSDEITQPWTSLLKITGKLQDRNSLSALLLNQLIEILPEFEKNGLAHFMLEWNSYDALLGKHCEIKTGSEYKSGIAAGINSSGELRLKTNENTTETINSGEIILSR